MCPIAYEIGTRKFIISIMKFHSKRLSFISIRKKHLKKRRSKSMPAIIVISLSQVNVHWEQAAECMLTSLPHFRQILFDLVTRLLSVAFKTMLEIDPCGQASVMPTEQFEKEIRYIDSNLIETDDNKTMCRVIFSIR